MAGHFSLASFAHNLSQAIFDRSLVVDFRDCWSLDIIMDQLQLHSVESENFRPDFQFKEINVENMFQVNLLLLNVSQYIFVLLIHNSHLSSNPIFLL